MLCVIQPQCSQRNGRASSVARRCLHLRAALLLQEMHDASEQQQVAKGAASTKSSLLQAEASSLQQQLQHAEGTAHQRRSEAQMLQQALSTVQQQLQEAREQLVAAATERDLLKQVLQVSGRDWSEQHVCATAVTLRKHCSTQHGSSCWCYNCIA